VGINAWTVTPQPGSGQAGLEERQWGYTALLADHKEEAVRWLGDATTLEPKSPELRVDSAFAYRGPGNTSAATAAYKEARKLKPDDPAYAVPTDQ
jgi:Flp pilus assembly protein TadD